MGNHTAEEMIALEDAISFRDVKDLKEMKRRLKARATYNNEVITKLAYSSKMQDELDRHKLLGEQELIYKILGQLNS